MELIRNNSLCRQAHSVLYDRTAAWEIIYFKKKTPISFYQTLLWAYLWAHTLKYPIKNEKSAFLFSSTPSLLGPWSSYSLEPHIIPCPIPKQSPCSPTFTLTQSALAGGKKSNSGLVLTIRLPCVIITCANSHLSSFHMQETFTPGGGYRGSHVGKWPYTGEFNTSVDTVAWVLSPSVTILSQAQAQLTWRKPCKYGQVDNSRMDTHLSRRLFSVVWANGSRHRFLSHCHRRKKLGWQESFLT